MNWKLVAEFDVFGIPKAQGRPRAFRKGNHARVYNPKDADDWKSLVALEAQKHLPGKPIDGPVRFSVTFFFPRPKKLMRKKDPDGPVLHTVKPDRDNAEKAVLDVLSQIGMWRDDCQVCAGPVEKYYHEKDGRPGAYIRIETLEDLAIA